MNRFKLLVIATLISIATMSQLHAQQFARLQAIHNSADPQLAVVDVYISLSGFVLAKLEDIAFRTATPFVDAPADVSIDVGIAPQNSATVSDTIKNFPITLTPNLTYIGVVNGVLDPNQFAPNPDGRPIALDAFITDQGREISSTPGSVELAGVHGVTDAPTVDVVAQGIGTLMDDAAYGDISNYVAVAPDSLIVDVTDASGTNTLASFEADLTALADSAAFVFASGFLDPGANQNGAPLGLFAALPGGSVIEFTPVTTGIGDDSNQLIRNYELAQNYPNPFNPTTTISFAIPQSENVSLTIFNIVGQEVATLVNGRLEAGRYDYQFDAPGLSSGLYFYQIKAGNFTDTKKMMLIR